MLRMSWIECFKRWQINTLKNQEKKKRDTVVDEPHHSKVNGTRVPMLFPSQKRARKKQQKQTKTTQN
jgi:hypothetical protein